MENHNESWSNSAARFLAPFLGCAILPCIVTNAFGFDPIVVEGEAPSIRLEVIGTYRTGIFDASAAEIAAHDPETQRLFVVNVANQAIDVLDIQEPSDPAQLFAIDVSGFGFPTSVAVQEQLVAVAIGNATNTDPGTVAFFDVDGNHLNDVTVGAAPDMVIFTPGGGKVLSANGAEPNDDLTADPEGSISIIDISRGVHRATVTNVGFTKFNDQKDELLRSGVRIIVPDATVAEDLEPEYIAVSHDSRTAWVTLEPNNALAIVDIKRGEVTDLVPLGFKDHSLPGNELDASDRDGPNNDGAINIRNWPVLGMYQPDAIAAFRAHRQTFLVTANEGKDINLDAFEEEVKVEDAVLDPDTFPDAAELKKQKNLGRLRVSPVNADPDEDGDFDKLCAVGGRSFSIWSAEGALVFDSGADFEKITALAVPEFFNPPDAENVFDDRSDRRGPEPEGVTTGRVSGHIYAFTVLERNGGVMVYDVSDPYAPRFEQYINNRNFDVDPAEVCQVGVPETLECAAVGDLKPEGVLFISLQDSPIDTPLLVLAHEASGSTTLYRILRTATQDDEDDDDDDEHDDDDDDDDEHDD